MPTSNDMNNIVSQGPSYFQPTGPFAGVYSGDYNISREGGFNGQSTNGHNWSSTTRNSMSVYSLDFSSTTASVGFWYKDFGFGVRCLVK
jgi:hypothetical protein